MKQNIKISKSQFLFNLINSKYEFINLVFEELIAHDISLYNHTNIIKINILFYNNYYYYLIKLYYNNSKVVYYGKINSNEIIFNIYNYK